MDQLPDLRRWLASHSTEGAELRLSRYEVKALADELHRLQQSNDRLRKQNKKVRKKVERLKPGAGDELAAGEDPAASDD